MFINSRVYFVADSINLLAAFVIILDYYRIELLHWIFLYSLVLITL